MCIDAENNRRRARDTHLFLNAFLHQYITLWLRTGVAFSAVGCEQK